MWIFSFSYIYSSSSALQKLTPVAGVSRFKAGAGTDQVSCGQALRSVPSHRGGAAHNPLLLGGGVTTLPAGMPSESSLFSTAAQSRSDVPLQPTHRARGQPYPRVPPPARPGLAGLTTAPRPPPGPAPVSALTPAATLSPLRFPLRPARPSTAGKAASGSPDGQLRAGIGGKQRGQGPHSPGSEEAQTSAASRQGPPGAGSAGAGWLRPTARRAGGGMAAAPARPSRAAGAERAELPELPLHARSALTGSPRTEPLPPWAGLSAPGKGTRRGSSGRCSSEGKQGGA